MALADIITGFATSLNIPRGDAAQLLVGLLTALVGISAALAAWRAAAMARATVAEMQEARLQGVRPHLIITGSFEIQYTLEDCAVTLRDRMLNELVKARKYKVFEITNVGLGPAVNITTHFELASTTFVDEEVQLLQNFFAQRGMTLRGSTKLVVDDLDYDIKADRSSFNTEFYADRVVPKILAPNEPQDIEVSIEAFNFIMMKILAYAMRRRKQGSYVYSEAGNIVVSYSSHAGEKFTTKMGVYLGGYAHPREKAHLLSREPARAYVTLSTSGSTSTKPRVLPSSELDALPPSG